MFLFLVLFQVQTLNNHVIDLFQNEKVCESRLGFIYSQEHENNTGDIVIFECDIFDEKHSQVCWELFNTSPI